jgi:hypothetical protein
VKSKIALSEDTWTTRAMTFTFAGTIGSWITSDWELIERVLDFHPIEDKEHEGEYAAIGLAQALSDLEILEKMSFLSHLLHSLSVSDCRSDVHIISATLDNAPPNDVLIRALSRLLGESFDIQFVPENSQIRCLAHVVNLVVQKILSVLNDAEDPDVKDDYLPNKDLPIHYDPDSDPDVRDLEEEEFSSAINENEKDPASALLAAGVGTSLEGLTTLQKVSLHSCSVAIYF